MTPISIHGRPLRSIFELLGQDENDMTFALGWALAQCPRFLHGLVDTVFSGWADNGDLSIELQRHSEDRGYSDIEITSSDVHLIVEAKRGWTLPEISQLNRYRARFTGKRPYEAFVVLSNFPATIAAHRLPSVIDRWPVKLIAWSEFKAAARLARATPRQAEKRLLHELLIYLHTAVQDQDRQSNHTLPEARQPRAVGVV